MQEHSTCLNCRTYQEKHNDTIVLTYEWHTEQSWQEKNFTPNNYSNPQAPPRVNYNAFLIAHVVGQTRGLVICALIV